MASSSSIPESSMQDTTQGTSMQQETPAYVCSWFSGINPLIGFEPSIFELSIFIRGKEKTSKKPF